MKKIGSSASKDKKDGRKNNTIVLPRTKKGNILGDHENEGEEEVLPPPFGVLQYQLPSPHFGGNSPPPSFVGILPSFSSSTDGYTNTKIDTDMTMGMGLGGSGSSSIYNSEDGYNDKLSSYSDDDNSDYANSDDDDDYNEKKRGMERFGTGMGNSNSGGYMGGFGLGGGAPFNDRNPASMNLLGAGGNEKIQMSRGDEDSSPVETGGDDSFQRAPKCEEISKDTLEDELSNIQKDTFSVNRKLSRPRFT